MNKKGKKSVFTYGLTALIMATLLFAGCTSSTENEKSDETKKIDNAIDNAKKDLEAAKEEYEKQYKAFKIESESKITENERIITELKSKPKNKDKAIQAEIDKTLTELADKNHSLKDEIENYRDNDYDKWEAFKDEFNRDMDNLGEALKDLTKENVK